jgi:hypothetical protein
MRDALVEMEYALRDYQFALCSTERQTAEREAFQWIELAQARSKKTENGR